MTSCEDIPYRTVDGNVLKGLLYRPDSPNGKWLIDVHGGAWGSGDRLNNAVIHDDLASNGIGVFALDFRLSNVSQYPAPVQDVSWGIRWFKINQRALGIQASSIGGLASSSGAQQLGLASLCPNGGEWKLDAPEISGEDSSLNFLVAVWPVFDPLQRYYFAQRTNNTRLISAHDTYFSDKADMETGNPHQLLERGDATHLPPILILQGTKDANVEYFRQDEFVELYRTHGGNAEILKFSGQGHNFIAANPQSEASKAAIFSIREFVLNA